jgi:hypothetical protein
MAPSMRKSAFQAVSYASAIAAACALAGIASAEGERTGQPPFDPTDRYEVRQIEGFRVPVNKGFVQRNPDLCRETLKLLGVQLYQVHRKAPKEAVEKLRKIAIWVEEAEPHHPCMAYHPDAGWLREHGMNPDKAGCVEVANAKNFLAWTREQPWMVLHELAHGYHDRFLGGYGNPELRAAYERMIASKKYDAVLHVVGRTERAYATRNPMEYFAETSEALFGTNDFYPFVAAELKQHDPEMHKLLQKLWGVRR